MILRFRLFKEHKSNIHITLQNYTIECFLNIHIVKNVFKTFKLDILNIQRKFRNNVNLIWMNINKMFFEHILLVEF